MILAMAMSAFASVSVAQVVSPVDFMRHNPRNVFANPACYTADYGYFDFLLGGINVSAQHMGLKYDRFFHFNDAGRPVVLDFNQGVASLRTKNYLNTYATIDIFNCGRQTKYGYFTYSHRFREMENMHYNKEFFQLMADGNAGFLGEENAAHANIGLSFKAFQEFNFGYQMALTEKLDVGARFKFLMGYADVKTKDLVFQLATDPNTYALTASGAVNVRATLPYEVSMQHGVYALPDSRFNMANLFKNYGAGIDLGVEYRIDDQYGVAASVNDLGFIRWNNNAVRFVGGIQDVGSMYDNGSLVFSGLSAQQVNGYLTDPDYIKKFVDTLVRYFDLNSEALKGYTTGLNTTLMVRGYYDLTPEHRFSAQLMGYASGIGFNPSLTLAYTGSFADKYDVVGTYTMMKGSYANIGVGLSANLGGCLIYFASNNVLGFINPANISNVNFQFGISFTGGERTARSERIFLKENQEDQEVQEVRVE